MNKKNNLATSDEKIQDLEDILNEQDSSDSDDANIGAQLASYKSSVT